MVDRTRDLHDLCVKSAPYLDAGPVSLLSIREEVRRRRGGLFTTPFHRRASEVSRALRSLTSAGSKVRSTPTATMTTTTDTHILSVSLFARSRFQRGGIEGSALVALRDVQTRVTELQREVGLVAEGDDWRGRPQRGGGHDKAHRVGVVVTLVDKLKEVGEIQRKSLAAQAKPSSMLWSSRPKVVRGVQGAPPPPSSRSPPREAGSRQDQSLVLENRELLAELRETGESAAQVQRTMVEISQLNQVFSTQIQEQSEQLELLYEEALEATVNLDKGNVELGKALKYNKEGGRIIISIILFFTAALLFLDWYQG